MERFRPSQFCRELGKLRDAVWQHGGTEPGSTMAAWFSRTVRQHGGQHDLAAWWHTAWEHDGSMIQQDGLAAWWQHGLAHNLAAWFGSMVW